jgi:hypothetical protein
MEFLERMNAGRDAAAARRHRGLSTGADAKGWAWKRPEVQAGTWEATRLTTRQAWRSDRSAALAIYQRDVFPERFYSELDGEPEITIDDVIATRQAAFNASIPF